MAHENYHTMNGTKAEFSGFLSARLPIRVSYVLVFRVTTHLGGDNSFFFVFSYFLVIFGGVNAHCVEQAFDSETSRCTGKVDQEGQAN